MRRLSTFTLLVMGGLAVAACGGEMDDGNASDMDVAADDTPACYLSLIHI